MPDHMTPTDILRAARAKIERPECWTKGTPARNKSGRRVLPSSRSATCWCSLGALGAVALAWSRAEHFLVDAIPHPYVSSIITYNDAGSTTHADILALFTRAIAAAEKETP
jgi:hypothetical protein